MCSCGHCRAAHLYGVSRCCVELCPCKRYRLAGYAEQEGGVPSALTAPKGCFMLQSVPKNDDKTIRIFNKDVVDELSGYDRFDAIRRYHEWIKNARRDDRLQVRRQESRIYAFKKRREGVENSGGVELILKKTGGERRTTDVVTLKA